jgi:hypothetical protein
MSHMTDKFLLTDKQYKESREVFSNESGKRELWSVIDHWPLYVGVSNLARFVAISDIVRETLNVPGDIAEFGMWRGATTMLMAKLLKLWDSNGPKVIHGFDSFQGLTEFSDPDADAVKMAHAYKGNYAEIVDMIRLYELDGSIKIHKGLIEETLPAFLDGNKAQSFSLVYCDTDLYQSTKLILDYVHPRIVAGGLIIFDEWNMATYPGEGVAANEFLSKNGAFYKPRAIPGVRQPTLILERLPGSISE